MTTSEIKVMYPKLRNADNYICVTFDNDDEATFSMNLEYDQCDILVTWLIEQMTTMDKLQ
tara:strand:- start:12007 stop:12186 length:180 start_codon:yes stop_codon:yes gene_type:complete